MAAASETERSSATMWQRFFGKPHVPWVPFSLGEAARTDIVAGLALWGFLVPEAIAYAGLAKVPPQAGLYTLMFSLVLYGIFGASRHLVVTSTSASAATAGGIIVAVGGDPIHVLAALGVAVGLVFLLAAYANVAFVVRFISRPVNQGFILGLSIFILIGQLPHLLGVEKHGEHVIGMIQGLFEELGKINPVTAGIGIGALVLMSVLDRFAPKAPAGLLITIGAIVLSMALQLGERYNVELVGAIPLGMPSPVLPSFPIDELGTVIAGALGLALVIFTETVSIVDSTARRHGCDVDNTTDLRGLGVANLGSGLAGGLLAGGSLSATSVNEQGGARTQLATTVTALASVATGLWLAPVLESLPKTILAALIIHAVGRHVRLDSLRTIRRYSRAEFVLALVALLGVLLLDVIAGLLIAVICNMVYYVYRSLPIDLTREQELVPGELVLRVQGAIFYGNADEVRDDVQRFLKGTDGVRDVVLELPSQYRLDVTTAEMLFQLASDLRQSGVTLRFSQMPERTKARLERLTDPDRAMHEAAAEATEH